MNGPAPGKLIAAKETSPRTRRPRVGIVGGGLAGLAAVTALSESDVSIELFEQRRYLGGRAGSFYDQESGQWIDHCQHVAMGCCTNLADFCRRTGIAGSLRRWNTLHFFSRQGQRYDLTATRWMPAPLHLAPSLFRMGFLSRGDRLRIARDLWKLARQSPDDSPDDPTIGQWLQQQGESEAALQRFWSVVLVSALGETLDQASLAAARKVFVDGFMASRTAFYVDVPSCCLEELYQNVAGWLRERAVVLQLNCGVRRVTPQEGGAVLETQDGRKSAFDYVVIAVPWRRVAELFDDAYLPRLGLEHIQALQSAPITGIHLWFDRPITTLSHAVFVERLCQWMFNRGPQPAAGQQDHDQPPRRSMSEGSSHETMHYVQVVISASRSLAGRDRDDVCREVLDDLRAIFPAARNATLLHWKMVTQRDAVFSVQPGIDRLRPPQRTAMPGVMLAGDWTHTGWPSTMEGAVRSGYLAAEAILAARGSARRIMAPDLPQGWLARGMIRR